jgi:zinc transporter ZupT
MAGEVFGTVMVASALARAVTTGGIFTMRRYEQWDSEHVAYFVSFAAGVLISVSFIYIIPKSSTMCSPAPGFLLVGFLGLYLINHFLNTYVCHEYQRTNSTRLFRRVHWSTWEPHSAPCCQERKQTLHAYLTACRLLVAATIVVSKE